MPQQAYTALQRADILLGNEAKKQQHDEQRSFRHATFLPEQTRKKGT
jgi:hypothetical protein